MDLQWLLAVAGFCFVTCFTPGPNNLMLMASGLNFGAARTVPHLLGVAIGFPVMVFGVGLGVVSVFQAYPALYVGLKVISIVLFGPGVKHVTKQKPVTAKSHCRSMIDAL